MLLTTYIIFDCVALICYSIHSYYLKTLVIPETIPQNTENNYGNIKFWYLIDTGEDFNPSSPNGFRPGAQNRTAKG